MILNTIPVFGVIAAISILGERITWEQGVGSAVILIAFFLFEEEGETRPACPVAVADAAAELSVAGLALPRQEPASVG